MRHTGISPDCLFGERRVLDSIYSLFLGYNRESGVSDDENGGLTMDL